MYQFPNQQLYHHNPYQQCQLDHEALKQSVNIPEPQPQPQYATSIQTESVNVVTNEQLLPSETTNKEDELNQEVIKEKKKKKCSKKTKDETNYDNDGSEDKKGKKEKRSSVDTSTFSVEERLVAAVWVHERAHTNTTISEIKHNFRRRFGREPPSKTTLFAWERKLFSTGNVCDAPRTGRPINRKCHISEVAASIKAAPSLSLRARALALQVPRTTLHNILRKDLPYTAVKDKIDKARTAAAEKQQAKRRGKQPVTKMDAEVGPYELTPAAPPPPAPPPPPHTHTHMHYMMHAMHSHTHGYS